MPAAPNRDIIVNGNPVTTGASTLADLLIELGYGDRKVATAINGDFVPEAVRETTGLVPNARIEIVAPRQGG